MAWNGGVSLAIWMGGVAVELDAARRGSQQGEVNRAGQRPYAAICDAFACSLQIDILCGASAGGLNAALLAAAIQGRRMLAPEFLRSRWIEMGDFEALLQSIAENEPPALMQGEQFHMRLREVFEQLLEDPTPGAASAVGVSHSHPDPELYGGYPTADVLLDVQVTDVEGRERSFTDDWSRQFYAREYRAPVRFRRAGDYTPEALAAAARASASFPGAFEAERLSGLVAQLAGFPTEARYAIDGGLLENAPIRQAIELIPTRQASGPVKRFVCYVNADPPKAQPTPEEPNRPPLMNVLAYSLTLPRQARLVDQLYALEDARRRSGRISAGVELLHAGAGLFEVASVLLPSYQRRRAVLSLTELLDVPGVPSGPGCAQEILDKLEDPLLLPWIPSDLSVPSDPREWHWGIRAGQRILQLQLDVLARALAKTSDRSAEASIYDAREWISAALAALYGAHHDFTSPGSRIVTLAQLLHDEHARTSALAELVTHYDGYATTVYEFVREATTAFADTINVLPADALAVIPHPQTLFGSTGEPLFEHFLGLALAVEVIRRSFSDDFDIELGKQLHVAQLTPEEPTLLFTATPRSKQVLVPATAEQKLTGISFGHFGAFYRASWRANDFMWGRLDGAAHAVRLLVDPSRARALHARDQTPWTTLAGALLADSVQPSASIQRHLIREALGVETAGAPHAGGEDEDELANLRTTLEDAIKEDLIEGDGEFTRTICTRAVQCEVFAEEAPQLAEQVQVDRSAGAYDTSLGWDAADGDVWQWIEVMRNLDAQSSLPKQLGRDSGEELTSSLAARTISHAAIVGVNALAGTFPLARLLQPARVPFFTVQGVSARRRLDSAAVVIGFTGAAWYLAARYLTLPRPPKAQQVPLGALWSVNSLVLWVSLLCVIGVVAMPAARAVASRKNARRSLCQGAAAIALAAAGGGVALGWQWYLNGSAVALTSSGASYAPPQWLMWLVAAAGGFHVASQLQSVSGALSRLGGLTRGIVYPASLLVVLLGGLLAGFTMVNAIAPALDHWGWKTAIFALACIAPVVSTLYLRVWEKPWG